MVGWRFSYRNSNFKSWLWFGQLYSVVIFWFYLNFPSIREILNSKSYLFEWNKVIVFRTFGSCNFSIETFAKLDDISHSMFDFQRSENFSYVHNFNAFFCGPVEVFISVVLFILFFFLLSSTRYINGKIRSIIFIFIASLRNALDHYCFELVFSLFSIAISGSESYKSNACSSAQSSKQTYSKAIAVSRNFSWP